MNATARTETARTETARPPVRRPLVGRRSRTQTRPVDGTPSDMANEMLTRIIEGLSRAFPLSPRERELLYHFLFGVSAAVTGERIGIRETSVHKHLHRIYAKSGTETRRGLLEFGLALANQHRIVGTPRWNSPVGATLFATRQFQMAA
jgi:DNA-binding CsgD family transcriptional regulator